MSNYIAVKNNQRINLSSIPTLDYLDFFNEVKIMIENKLNHCVSYFAYPFNEGYKLIACIASDETKEIFVLSHFYDLKTPLNSLSSIHLSFHGFERELAENFGIIFENHPFLKPIRYPENRVNKNKVMDNYPFYEINSNELHEVGVGPIHAGIIEPGYFRFICNGEKVLHLEIQLGYQHRGIENLMIENKSHLQRTILSEAITGDTTIGHSLAYAAIVESLTGCDMEESIAIERVIALELERIAVHIGDTAALCTDIAYQMGQVTCEALRTIIINTTQYWCGNRFGKGLIRAGGTNYPLRDDFISVLIENLEDVLLRYTEITERIYSLPSVLSRFEFIGSITQKQAESIGAVGMAARTSGVNRDIRQSHPFQYYQNFDLIPIIEESGDVWARAVLRVAEVKQSITLIRELISKYWIGDNKHTASKPIQEPKLEPNQFIISLVEGWRGEICHSAITDNEGKLVHYKIKDPSFHNWLALALSVRNQEISDFPICNKSFNLSYCGNDL